MSRTSGAVPLIGASGYAGAAREAGVERVIHLGGDDPLAEAPQVPAEVEPGATDVPTCREMMRGAPGSPGGAPRPLPNVPLLTSRLCSRWVALVTPVPSGPIEPLEECLGAEMPVRPPPAPIHDSPRGFEEAVLR